MIKKTGKTKDQSRQSSETCLLSKVLDVGGKAKRKAEADASKSILIAKNSSRSGGNKIDEMEGITKCREEPWLKRKDGRLDAEDRRERPIKYVVISQDIEEKGKYVNR